MRHPLSLSSLVLSLAAFAVPACMAAPATVANPSTCPVELSAAQHSAAMQVPVDNDRFGGSTMDLNRAQQAFDLSMKNSRLQRIVAAELEVHGTTNKSRVVPAGAAALTDGPTGAAVRNVHVVSSVPADETRTRTVSVKDLTSVAWISVIELRYADGSTWQSRPGAECRVVPDGVMLIAGK